LPAAALENLNRKYHLDKPVFPISVDSGAPFVEFHSDTQYTRYLLGLVQGDLGQSYYVQDREVSTLIKDGFEVSLQLGIAAFLFAVVFGLALGVLSALNHNGPLDYLGVFFSMVGASMPNFILGTFLIVIFAVQLGWFDVLGWGGPKDWEFWNPASTDFWKVFNPGNWDFRKVVLPVLALGVLPAAYFARITRASMLEVLNQDYIRTARAKGLSPYAVTIRHGLRNAMLPVITVLGLRLGNLLGGSVIIESVFALPGMGRLAVNAIFTQDFPVVMGFVLLIAVVVSLASLITDLVYGLADPRIKLGRTAA
jgi:oligopeptide transport system permease protein